MIQLWLLHAVILFFLKLHMEAEMLQQPKFKMSICDAIAEMSKKGYDVKRAPFGGQYGKRYNVYRAGYLVGRYTKSEIIREFIGEHS